MTVRLELSPEKEAALLAQAEARGLTIEQWLLELAEQHAPAPSFAHLQKTDPEEWARRFRHWAEGHNPELPVLPDDAMSRDAIYSDRD